MNSNTSFNNKRIAQNTLLLYIKLFVSTIVGLITSRYILKVLGVDDYGLYVIIGGIVTIMNFLGAVMTTTSYRFIAVELGKGDKGNPGSIYNTVRIIHIVLALLLLIVGESIGVYYVNNYLNIALSRIPDALYLLHWSILTAMMAILAIPSNGLIIARERFLYTSILEIARALLKLFLVILLMHYDGDRLRMFAIITFLYMSAVPLLNMIYCKMKEPTITKWKINTNLAEYKQVFSFASWTMLGAGSTITQTQGNAILINLFFSTAVNAAYGLASQVNGYVMMFVRNLGQAAIPQIMKNYSRGNTKESLSLAYHIAKYSFFIILFPAVPCILSMKTMLQLWLGDVPQYTSVFAILMIASNLFWCVSVGFDSTIQASGNIKRYQVGFSLITLSSLPISYFLFSSGLHPYAISCYIIFSNFCLLILQCIILKRMGVFSLVEYWHKTLKPVISTLAFMVPLFIMSCYMEQTTENLVIKTIFSILYIGIIEYFIGLNNEERKLFSTKIRNFNLSKT